MVLSLHAPIRTLLGFISDRSQEVALHAFALRKLNEAAPHHWFQIADTLTDLEQTFNNGDDLSNECLELTALLLSQVHFHLEQHPDALRYALRAKEEFTRLFRLVYPSLAWRDVKASQSMNPLKQFVDMIIALAIDEYIRIRCEEVVFPSSELDSFVATILDVDHSLDNFSMMKLFLGISMEACNLDRAEAILRVDPKRFDLVEYLVENHELLIPTKSFRVEVLGLVSKIYAEVFQCLFDAARDSSKGVDGEELPESTLDQLPQYCDVLIFLDDHDTFAHLIKGLVNSSQNNYSHYLRALQLAFDLTSIGSQSYLDRVRNHSLLQVLVVETKPSGESASQDDPAAQPLLQPIASSSAEVKITDVSVLPPTTDKVNYLLDGLLYTRQQLHYLRKILLGDSEITLFLKFAHKKNATDLEILEAVKNGLDHKHNVLHMSLIVAHGLMQRGTTCDVFLRKNLDWFARAVCWGKFTATASLGVIHQTHVEKSFRVLSTYLPGFTTRSNGAVSSSNTSSFSDGGSLYALGLIHANRSDATVTQYLLSQLQSGSGFAGSQILSNSDTTNTSSTVNEVTQHGAALGLGLASMGCADISIYESLRAVLLMDSAVSGEAAALGIGLIMVGSGNVNAIDDLLQYAKETRHEKIIRACGLAVALICLRCEEESADIVQKMISDNDPLVRYGGCFALALAYCGTARETALQKLLHVAVSDTSDDVRRASVLSISYVLCHIPEQTPKVLKLLADSFNFHVRFAATLAIGISCAGTASEEALSYLVPATKDSSDVVRQAAYISLGLVMMECPEKYAANMQASQVLDPSKEVFKPSPLAKPKPAAAATSLNGIPTPSQIRDHLVAISTDRREDVMSRVGSIIGLGLLEAGGRNSTASFFSNRGSLRQEAVVGFLLFSQYWYWYPLMLSISLTFQPTTVIGLNGDLKVPESFQLESRSPPSVYAYPKPYQVKKKEIAAPPPLTILSASKRRLGVRGNLSAPKQPVKLKEILPAAVEPVTETENIFEPNSEMIQNMSRIVPMQQSKIYLPAETRYTPIFSHRRYLNGILILKDSQPGTAEIFLESLETVPAPTTGPTEKTAPQNAPTPQEEEITAVPEPFELD